MSEDRAMQLKLEREKREKQLRKEAYMEQAREEVKLKKQEKEEIINRLASGRIVYCRVIW
jgi:hypothetical protein